MSAWQVFPIKLGVDIAAIWLISILLRHLFPKKGWGILTSLGIAVGVYVALGILLLVLRRF
jgi:hypothetical protein